MVLVPADILLALPIFRGLYTGNDSLVLGGVAALLPIHMLTGPMIHCMHGMCIRGLTAFANNWSMSGVPYMAGALTGNGTLTVTLATLGVLAAQAFDIFEFSYEPWDKPMAERHGRRVWLPSSIGIVPMIEGNRQGVSIIGRF
ncbi:MAG: hypothetical protein IPM54_33475 [Polyangiaceae bacterium]|nr:hypothetical protein [Polyangiaceae bacterium]